MSYKKRLLNLDNNPYIVIQLHYQVSEASQNLDNLSSQDNKILLQDISNMLQTSNDGKTEVNEQIEKAKSHYTEAMFISTQNQAMMENCFEDW